jgi:hypothetical protein
LQSILAACLFYYTIVFMKKTIVLLSVLTFAVIVGCAKNSMEVSYDANTWQDVIDSSCQSFFDGCNQCMRMPGSDMAACTKMYCETYAQPYCTDQDISLDPIVELSTGLSAIYVGLSLEDAIVQADADNVLFRVTEQDGEPLPATMDYRPGRINATVIGGVVVDIFIE